MLLCLLCRLHNTKPSLWNVPNVTTCLFFEDYSDSLSNGDIKISTAKVAQRLLAKNLATWLIKARKSDRSVGMAYGEKDNIVWVLSHKLCASLVRVIESNCNTLGPDFNIIQACNLCRVLQCLLLPNVKVIWHYKNEFAFLLCQWFVQEGGEDLFDAQRLSIRQCQLGWFDIIFMRDEAFGLMVLDMLIARTEVPICIGDDTFKIIILIVDRGGANATLVTLAVINSDASKSPLTGLPIYNSVI